MMEGSDQEGGSSAASMEETSANGECVCGIKFRTYWLFLSFLIGPISMLSCSMIIYMSGGAFDMFI